MTAPRESSCAVSTSVAFPVSPPSGQSAVRAWGSSNHSAGRVAPRTLISGGASSLPGTGDDALPDGASSGTPRTQLSRRRETGQPSSGLRRTRLVDLHDDLPLFHANRVGAHANVGVDRRDAGLEIEGPAVPRAGDHAGIFEIPLPQRAALMRTGVVERDELP